MRQKLHISDREKRRAACAIRRQLGTYFYVLDRFTTGDPDKDYYVVWMPEYSGLIGMGCVRFPVGLVE